MCLVGAHLLDREARLVLVQVLADEARLAVVRPDEGLPAVRVVEGVRIAHLVADRLQIEPSRELVELLERE